MVNGKGAHPASCVLLARPFAINAMQTVCTMKEAANLGAFKFPTLASPQLARPRRTGIRRVSLRPRLRLRSISQPQRAPASGSNDVIIVGSIALPPTRPACRTGAQRG